MGTAWQLASSPWLLPVQAGSEPAALQALLGSTTPAWHRELFSGCLVEPSTHELWQTRSPPAGAEVPAPHAAATREETDAERAALCSQLCAHSSVPAAPACTHSCDADGEELAQDREDSGDGQALTNQNEDTDQQRDEGAGAQRG